MLNQIRIKIVIKRNANSDIHKMFTDLIDSEKGRRTLGIIPSFITVADEVAYGHNFEIGNMERIDPE